jgi:argininosuccinate lyase
MQMFENNSNNNANRKKLWGGRFSESPSGITEKISASIHFDLRLYHHDIRGSIAHAKMLHRIKILTRRTGFDNQGFE